MNMDDFELEKLRNEIQQEKQMKEMLEQSAAELRATVEELEKRYDTIDNEGNEWKTRFETQQEMNEQLERQILMLQNKVQEAKTNLKDDEEAEKEKKGITDENEQAEEKQSQSSPASNSNKSKSRVTIVTGNDDTPFSDNNTDNKEQATKEVKAKKGVQIKKEVQSKKEMQPKKEVQSKKEMQAKKEEQAKKEKVKMEKEKTREKPSNESTVIRGILKNKGIQVDASGIKSETPAIQSKVKNRNKRPVSSGHLEKQGTKVIILTDRTPKRFIKIDPKVYLSHEVRPPARRQAWESSAPIETENKIDKDEKVRIFGSTRLKNISYKEKFIQSKQQRSMMQQNLESGDKTSNIRGDLTFRNSDLLRKNRRSKKYARNGASQKVGAMEEPLQQSDSKEQSNRKKTVKEFMAERQQDDDVEARTQKNSSLEKHSRKTPVKEQTSGKPPTEISNKMSSEKAENSALVRSVSDGKVIMKRAEKTDPEENVRKAKSEIIQVKRNEKSTITPDMKKSSEPSVAIEIPANDPQDTLQENEVDDIKPTSKFPRTIKIRTKPGSYLRAKAYVAARDLASRGSKTNQSEYSPEDLSKFLPEEWSKPGTAMTKSTGISINIAISPRGAGKTPRDLKNFDDLSDPTGYHVRMLEKQKIVLGNQLKEIQDRLDHESQANPHMIRMLDKEKNVLHNQLRDMEWRLDQESKANAHMVQMLEREKHILQGQLRDLEWRLDQESKPNLRVVQSLEKRKNMLQNQLRDIEWRIDQESKAYHKANDERKSYALEINTTKGVISELVTKQKMSSSREHLETIPGSRTPRAMGSRQTMSDASAMGDGSLRSILSAHSSTSSQGSNKRVQWSPHLATPATEKRISLNDGDTPSPVDSPRRSKIKVRHTNYRSISNIPEDRRILDPKRGPIQKTAAVKNLPSLEST